MEAGDIRIVPRKVVYHVGEGKPFPTDTRTAAGKAAHDALLRERSPRRNLEPFPTEGSGSPLQTRGSKSASPRRARFVTPQRDSLATREKEGRPGSRRHTRAENTRSLSTPRNPDAPRSLEEFRKLCEHITGPTAFGSVLPKNKDYDAFEPLIECTLEEQNKILGDKNPAAQRKFLGGREMRLKLAMAREKGKTGGVRNKEPRRSRPNKRRDRRTASDDDDDVLDSERGGFGAALIGADDMCNDNDKEDAEIVDAVKMKSDDRSPSVSSSESSFVDLGCPSASASDAGSSFSIVGGGYGGSAQLPAAARIALVDKRIRANLKDGAFDPERVRRIETELRRVVDEFAAKGPGFESAIKIDSAALGEGGRFARMCAHGVAQFFGLDAFSRRDECEVSADGKVMWLRPPADAADAAALMRQISLADHLAAQ